MNRLSRAAAAGALASAVALGVTVPADAAPKAGNHKVHTTRADAATKNQSGKLEQQVNRFERKLAGEVARKDRFLARLLERDGVELLEDTVETALRANVESDRARLAELRTAMTAAGTLDELRTSAGELRGFRPERYNVVLNQMRQAGRLLLEAEGDAETTAALDALVAELMAFTARTSRGDLRAAQAVLSAVDAALDEAADTGTGDTETGDTGTGDTETGDVAAV